MGDEAGDARFNHACFLRSMCTGVMFYVTGDRGPVMCGAAALLWVCKQEITGLSTIPLPHIVERYRSAPRCSFLSLQLSVFFPMSV